jgi:hypothetical protein
LQLVLQRLAPDAQPLPIQPLLLQLPTQQLCLLLGLRAPFLGITQLAVGVFQGQSRVLELVLDAIDAGDFAKAMHILQVLQNLH